MSGKFGLPSCKTEEITCPGCGKAFTGTWERGTKTRVCRWCANEFTTDGSPVPTTSLRTAITVRLKGATTMAKAKLSKGVKKTTEKKVTVSPRTYGGKTTGLSLKDFYLHMFPANLKAKKTDEQLLKELRAEFPNAKRTFEAKNISGPRAMFNKGKLPGQTAVPSVPLHPFDDAGNPLPLWGEGGKKKAAAASNGTNGTKKKLVLRKKK